MNLNQVLECESRQFQKFKKFLFLPNYFKKIGLTICLISVFSILILGYFTQGNEIIKLILKKVVLVSLLSIALAREKIEDELIEKIRGQAYTIAFILGVIYTLVQPFINYLVAAIVSPEKAVFTELSVFVILWFMLIMYLCFFHVLVRTR